MALTLASALIALTPATALAAGSATTNPASKVHHTTAVLNGHLDPEGDPGVTDCYFEWGQSTAYGNTVPCGEGTAFGAPADVSALASGLSPATTYHFRLHIETTSSGPIDGADQSFRTIPIPSEHQLIASFGPDGTPGSSFSHPENRPVPSPAMHQLTRRLYVGARTPTTNLIHGFDASAPPVFPTLGGFPLNTNRTNANNSGAHGMAIAVDNTGLGSDGNVYFITEDGDPSTLNEDELHGITSSGAALPGFPIDLGAEASGVAVNSSGEVWVALPYPFPGKVLKYSPAGQLLGSLDLPSLAQGATVRRISFDSESNLYVSSNGGIDKVPPWKFSAASDYTSSTKLPEPPDYIWVMDFDAARDYLYVSSPDGTVGVYDVKSGKLFDEFETAGGTGIATDSASQVIYAGGGNKVSVYATGAPLLPPTATTAPAGPIAGSKATLNGFVDPEGVSVTECEFEYGKGTGYGNSVPCDVDPGSGSGDVAVSAEVTGLTPNTTYHYRIVAANSAATGKGEDEVFATNPPPAISSPGVENLTFNSAKLKALVNPKGYETTYHFEYGTTTAYGTKVPVPDSNAGSGTSDVAASASISGLSPDTVYHWRLVAENPNGQVATADQTFTSFGPVKAETTGSPLRTSTSAQLQARINPDGAPTTYRFEYGTQGPCDANPCTATPDRPAGSGGVYVFVSEQVEGLEPGTTYHYRVIAESPNPGGPATGEDMTVTTRASDAPLSHGRLPGPVGSDRAYEQVSIPDTGGNPIGGAYSVSDDGNRAFYQVTGGTPLSTTGSFLTQLFAERIETGPHQGGWRSHNIGPPREDLVGSQWLEPFGSADLSNQVAANIDSTTGLGAIWRLRPGLPAVKLVEPGFGEFYNIDPIVVSEDGSRVVAALGGVQDPAHTPPSNERYIYDISSGTPRFIAFMPDGSMPTCGISNPRVSSDGSLVFFSSCGNLYVRDLFAEETKLIATKGSGGFQTVNFIRSTEDAAFLVTYESIAPDDSGGDDLYRYDLDDETYDCVTCVSSGLEGGLRNVRGAAVAEDGSRAYFGSFTELVRGAASPGIYRVDVASGDLAYVAPADQFAGGVRAVAPDGGTIVFGSKEAGLNALGGLQNGGTLQFYRYDDEDRSVVCLTCPQDGSEPANSSAILGGVGFGRTSISDDGRILAFTTPNPLLTPDQNTARAGQKPEVGTDVYEWRDGRLLLVTDGLTNWADGGPTVEGVTPSGRDIFFTAAKQYTKDALDGYRRLYTARIDGGFEIHPPPKPCPLEVCQGTPKGAPEEQEPGSGNFSGPGNKAAAPSGRRSCPKGRHKAGKGSKARCVKSQGKGKAQQKKRQRAKHDRRNAR